MSRITAQDETTIRDVFNRLKAFSDKWQDREDDPEEMWTEAPEMAAALVSAMEPMMSRIGP